MIVDDFLDYLFSKKAYWFWIWGTALVVMALVAIGFWAADVNPWGDVTCDRVITYASEQCEVITKSGLIRQQANFWSNFAYAVFGLFILFRRSTAVAKSIGAAFVFLAVTSGLFHGTLTTWGQYLDIMGIDVLLLLLILHSIYCTWEITPENVPLTVVWICSLTVVGLLMGILKSFFDSTLVSFASAAVLLVIGAYATGRRYERWGEGQARWATWMGALALSVFLFAVLFKFLDGKQVTAFAPEKNCPPCNSSRVDDAPAQSCTGKCPEPCCDQACACCQDIYNAVDSPKKCHEVKPKLVCGILGSNPVIQGHGLWHAFSAAGLFFVFEFFGVLLWKEKPHW